MFKKTLFLSLFLLLNAFIFAQKNTVTYTGNGGSETFYDVAQLSNGKFLICGVASDLDWIPSSVPRTIIANKGINNGQGTQQIGFFLLLENDLSKIIQVAHFQANTIENIRFMKFSNLKGNATGDLFISGDTKDTKANNGGYFLAKLNNNFVKGIPNGLSWAQNIWAEGYVAETHPWDVGSDGKVVYMTGQSHAADWAAMHRLDANGNRELVENFRAHWKKTGGEYYGSASSFADPNTTLDYSGMVLKNAGNRCSFRSWTQKDFDVLTPDGNGSKKKGAFPLDVFFNSPCTPGVGPATGPGYTGYNFGGSTVWGASTIVVDRRDNSFFLGMNMKSVLPSGQPDFEPAVVAFDKSGALTWWSRLYHEIKPNTTDSYLNSTPDQYIDGLSIDYANNKLVVDARTHGNNVENFWEGNTVAAVPLASGFQNQFTGTNGNIHLSWLGKLGLKDGALAASTYVGELNEGVTTGLGKALTEPNMGTWNNPNDGWANLNTTYIRKNATKITANGSVCVIGIGRRTMTTANAFQKMPLPTATEKGSWNNFVRVYPPDFKQPLYSSLLVGEWDKTTGKGGDNTEIYGIWKTAKGVIAVGCENTGGNAIPTSNIPNWGVSKPNGSKSAIFAYFEAKNLENADDEKIIPTSATDDFANQENLFNIAPNPIENNEFLIKNENAIFVKNIIVTSFTGQKITEYAVNQSFMNKNITLPDVSAGLYIVQIQSESKVFLKKIMVVK